MTRSIGSAAGAFKADERQVVRYTSSGYVATYPLKDYGDLGAALQDAHDDAVAAGESEFIAEISAGIHVVTTPVTCELPPHIVGRSSPDPWFDDPTGTAIINDTGGYWLTLRGTDNSPQADRINHGHIEGLHMEPSTQGAAVGSVLMDGTTATNPDGSIVRGVTFENVGTFGHGDPAIAYDGTVFDITFRGVVGRHNTSPTVAPVALGTRTAGPASQFRFIDCYLFGKNGYAVHPAANSTVFLGGSIATLPGGSGINGGGSTGLCVFGTHLEGTQEAGSVGILHNANGPSWYLPTGINRWDTGIQVGDGSTNQAQDARIMFQHRAGNVTEDVKVTSGGSRARTILDVASNYTVTDNRAANDGLNEVYEWSLTQV